MDRKIIKVGNKTYNCQIAKTEEEKKKGLMGVENLPVDEGMLEDTCYFVYKHENKINGKCYIGITCQKPEQRWRKGKGYKNGHFKNAIDKYGWDNFEHIILYENLTKEEACKKEYELIKKYDTTNPLKGYNSCDGGGVTVGYHHTKESKEKMSKTKIGMYKGDKNPMYGKERFDIKGSKNWNWN